MEQGYDRSYYEQRLQRCRSLADQATTPSIREVHLHHANYYEFVLLNARQQEATLIRSQITAPSRLVTGAQ